jgi:hypothetical protein
VTTKTLHFQESGYTGYNLLDPEQPTFAIASTDFESDMAEKILRDSFPDYQGEEFTLSVAFIQNALNISARYAACSSITHLPFFRWFRKHRIRRFVRSIRGASRSFLGLLP